MPSSRTPEILGEEIRAMAAAAHDYVEGNFSASEHLSDKLQALLRPLEVTTCQGAYPVLTVLMATMSGLSNGASIQLWNAGPTPISAMVLYAGDAQQGKSRLTAAVSSMIAAADEEIAAIVQQRLESLPPPEGVEPAEWEGAKPKKLTVRTIGMQDFTPTELFARCSGEWAQIKEAPDLMDSVPGLKPRAWFSTLVNLDEAYSFLGKIGLTTGDVRGGASRETAPSEHASTLNALLGTGKLQRDTRTSGCYGGVGTPAVNLAIVGNWHWKMLLAVERGLVGNHVAATKERSLYCAGASAKRHEDLPADFALAADQPRWTWLPLTAKLAQSFGWSAFYQSPDIAAQNLVPAPPEDGLAQGVAAAEPGARFEHVGPEHGYKAQLPDGVELRLRYVTDNGALKTQYRISGRWALPSAHEALVAGVRRVVRFFRDRPHHTIPFEPAARELLLGAQLEQSLLAGSCRGDDGAGEAQHGAAAGQIGVWAALASMLRLAADEDMQTLSITAEDVELSTRVVQISLRIKEFARSPDLVGRAGRPAQLCESTPLAHRPACGDYDTERFAGAFLTQRPLFEASPLDAGGIGDEEEDAVGPAAVDQGSAMDAVPEPAAAPSPEPPAAAAAATPLQIADLKPEAEFFEEGLGLDGGMLLNPSPDGQRLSTDRHLLRKLILTGQASTTTQRIADSMRFYISSGAAVGGKKGRTRAALPIADVRALLVGFAAQYSRICTFADDTLVFRDFPADEAAQVKLHNEFMRCARVTLHEVSRARIMFLRKRPAPASAEAAPAVARSRPARAAGATV